MSRTLIVGDVHGCAAELAVLLDRVGHGPDDRVFFVGDLVARGPDSRGVLDQYRRVGGRSVRGNHEERLLAARRARLQGGRRPRLSPPHYSLMRNLGEDDWELLEALPLFIDLPEHGVRIVHAGVLPSRRFEEQDAWTLTHVRTIDEHGAASDSPDHQLWGSQYGGDDVPHVVFGHNSRAQLQLHPMATGLDTACVYGGQLSALVLRSGQPVPTHPDERRALITSVPAAGRYYAGMPRSRK